jgi:hypothetical protein
VIPIAMRWNGRNRYSLVRYRFKALPKRCKQKTFLGAVGIENNDERNFKDLQGMRRNTKSLKRNDGERKGILIAPSNFLVFFSAEILTVWFSRLLLRTLRWLRAHILRRGWQADEEQP